MRRTFSIHASIALLAIAAVLPVLIYCAVLVERARMVERELIERSIRDTVHAASADLDRRVEALLSLGQTIADARTLRVDDLPAFYVRWIPVVQRERLTLVLYDLNGQQLVNSSVPPGMALPAEPVMIGRVLETGDVDYSGLIRALPGGSSELNISVPVRRDGRLTYVLTLRVMRAIEAVMSDQVLLPQETSTLIDKSGILIYRAGRSGALIGDLARPNIIKQIQERDEGAFLEEARDGVPIYLAFIRVKSTGWLLTISIPSADLFAPATRSLTRLLILGSLLLLPAGVIAWFLGRWIARSVTDLARLATVLADGTATSGSQFASRIREVGIVAASMRAGAEAMRVQIERREQIARTLRVEIEKRQQIEQQLIQSQKMEAIGQLTGGIAHDFNNLLAIVVGSLELIRVHFGDNPEAVALTEEASEAALRGAELTRQMLAFARRQPLAPEKTDVNDVILVFSQLLNRILGEDITIDLLLADNVWPVLIDKVQLEAAITNLATNARHAMPRGGQLSIAIRNTSLDEGYAETHLDVTPGEYVLIEVTDTGTGMPPEVLSRVFEPFYSTKEPGQGSGLGLSIVFGFLKQSGGHISAYSEVGIGSTFRLYLPRSRQGSAADTPHPPEVTEPEHGRGETVLAVEDNSGLRQVLVRQLIGAGYRVIEAGDAREAMEKLESGVTVDVLLTDIVMPGGMNGRELADRAEALRPDLKVILTSGFSEYTNDSRTSPGRKILRKPYLRHELLRLLNQALRR
jgi:signal transduction histidine kinase